MPQPNGALNAITTATNVEVPIVYKDALLVQITGNSSFDGNVNFQSTVDGDTFTNTPYIKTRSTDNFPSVAQIGSPTTVTEYLLLPPLTTVRLAVSAPTTGNLDVVWREVWFSTGLVVQTADTLSIRGTTSSATRATLLTPTSGKRVRVVSIEVTGQDATAHNVEVYFGTGANITTNAGNEICEVLVDLTDAPNAGRVWPGGIGPRGAVNGVVSIRCSSAPSTASIVHLKYREE